MSGAELKTALYNIIKDPKVIPYSHLWKVFETTDTRKNNKVWDMYSDRSDGGGPNTFMTLLLTVAVPTEKRVIAITVSI